MTTAAPLPSVRETNAYKWRNRFGRVHLSCYFREWYFPITGCKRIKNGIVTVNRDHFENFSKMCSNPEVISEDVKSVGTLPADDVQERAHDSAAKAPDVAPPKKRRTRRGKTKRRNGYPYTKEYRRATKLMRKPEAPHNSNQFLIEDHGITEELDQKLKSIEEASSSTVARTRDSSFSVDTVDSDDGEFYSSPDDEKEYLIKDFDDQYETLHAERLYSMSKNELIQEYLSLEAKVEQLTKRLLANSSDNDKDFLRSEVERLMSENERLKRENSELASRVSLSDSSDSADSETDSSSSCSSSTSSLSKPDSPVDYVHTNGHSPSLQEAV